MRPTSVATGLVFILCACGRAASPADSIALGPSKTCAEPAVWDGIECAAPHEDTDSDDGVEPAETANDRVTAKVAPCDDDDCDDDSASDHVPSNDGDLMKAGLAAYGSHDFPKARKLFYELISKHPNSVHVGDAYFWFGKMFEEDGKKDPVKLQLAAQSFLEAQKYPTATQGPAALLELGNVYMKLGDASKANMQYALLRKRFPGSAAATKIPPGH